MVKIDIRSFIMKHISFPLNFSLNSLFHSSRPESEVGRDYRLSPLDPAISESQNIEIGAKIERSRSVSDEEAYAGPAQFPNSSPTLSPPLPLKRARRNKGASEGDDVSERGEIRNEEFRAGGPHLCNLPVFSGPLNTKSQLYLCWFRDGLADEVKIFLDGFNVQWREILAVTRECARKSEAPVETIFILAERKALTEDWIRPCEAIRKHCISRGLFQANVELADERGLKPVLSSIVERTAPILQKWHILEPKILSLLGTEPWLAVELLRRGQDLTDNNNPITVVITIEEQSDSDWSSIRDKVVRLLEDSECAYVAVEIGRGIVSTGAQKDPRMLPEQAYNLPALPGTSIAARGSSMSAGTFGCYLKIRQSSNHKWETKGITCHHVLLPDYLQHPNKHRWDMYGIAPGEFTFMSADMPAIMDHIETVKDIKSDLLELDSEAHKEIARKLGDPSDAVIPSERQSYERVQKFIDGKRQILSRAEDFFAKKKQALGDVFAASGLRQAFPPSGPSHSYDWALINVVQSRLSTNKVCFLYSIE